MYGARLESGNETALINFDPRTKLLILLVANTVIISDSKNDLVVYLKYGFVILALLFLLDMKKVKMAVIYTSVYALAILGEQIVLRNVISGMSVAGVIVRIVTYLVERMLPSLMLAWFVLHTTKVSEFIAAMQKMRLPQTIIIPFATVFRFFPTLKEEYRSIQDAMKMRGIRFGTGIAEGIEYRMVPLLVSVTKIGDELSAAAMTRGLSTEKGRTSYCRIGLYGKDYAMLLLMIFSIAGFVLGLVRG